MPEPTPLDQTRIGAIQAQWIELQDRRTQLEAEDTAAIEPYAINGHVVFTAEVEQALGKPYLALCRQISEMDDEIERFRLEHFRDVIAALARLQDEHRAVSYVCHDQADALARLQAENTELKTKHDALTRIGQPDAVPPPQHASTDKAGS